MKSCSSGSEFKFKMESCGDWCLVLEVKGTRFHATPNGIIFSWERENARYCYLELLFAVL